jgi:tetraacyldisaccharide 4'-kinase
VHAPEFWTQDGGIAALLQPLAMLYAAVGHARQALTRPQDVAAPVICVGNLVAGGAGKTPVTLSLATRLATAGRRPHILTRGYRGRLEGPIRVDPARHDADAVGDEALLLARAAPCWVARDRVAGARRAIESGADLLLLDDGMQNPALAKDLSLIVVDGGYGFGNRRVIPAGPLREPIAAGLSRAAAIVILGTDETGSEAIVGSSRPVLHGRLVPQDGQWLHGRDVVAFAGIGRPAKFYRTLTETGARIVARYDFPDHHPYSVNEIEPLVAQAQAVKAQAVTTEKDWVRLPPALRAEITALAVAVEWQEPASRDALLASYLAPAPADG